MASGAGPAVPGFSSIAVLDSLFSFLFKYRPEAFARGDLALAAPAGLQLAALVVAGLAVGAAFTYASVRARSSSRDRGILLALRLGAVALLFLALLRPVLVLATTVPQRSFVAVLMDDSRSMTLDDGDGVARSRAALDAFEADTPLRQGLEERFGVRFFAFSRTAERIEGPGGLGFQGTRTHLGAALDRVREELSGVPLAGWGGNGWNRTSRCPGWSFPGPPSGGAPSRPTWW